MNNKEIAEIRRMTRRDRSNITELHCCFVNDNKEIIAQFSQKTGTMPENEAEQFYALLKRTLNGVPNRNLINLTFPTSTVAEGEEHKLLMSLRDDIDNEKLREEFFAKVVQSLSLGKSYLVILAYNTYDIPFKRADDTFDEEAGEVFRYLHCSICPVKQSKPVIEYKAVEKEFHNSAITQILALPALGFMFPAFDDRSTNIYGSLLYTRDTAANHEEFLQSVFGIAPIASGDAQKESFSAVLTESLGDDCSLDVVQAITTKMEDMIELHKESRIPEPVMVRKTDLASTLLTAGLEEAQVNAFEERFENAFGDSVAPENLIDKRAFVVKTTDVIVRVSPDKKDIVQTRIVDGKPCLVIDLDESVEVNGIPISISEEH